MVAPLEVFRVDEREPLWIDAAKSLDDAIALIGKAGAGKYLLFSRMTLHEDEYMVRPDGHVEFLKHVTN